MRQKLSLFLMKDDIQDFGQIVRSEEIEACIPLKAHLPFSGFIFLGRNHSNSPQWAQFLEDGTDSELPDIENRSTRAVLAIKVGDRYFAFTFGYGRHLLDPNAYVRDFGVKCVLNMVDPTTLKSIDKTVFDEMTVSFRIQTSRGAGVQAFGLDPVRDYVRAVTGRPTNQRLGKVISGSDALLFSSEATFQELGELCSFLYDKYNATDYRRNFEWYDNLYFVNDPALVARLDLEVMEAINSRDENRFHLAPPEVIDWELTGGFSFTPKGDINDDLELANYFSYLGNRQLESIAQLRRQFVFARYLDGKENFAKWKVYDCIVFETELDEDKYVLTLGNWFRINRDFSQAVADFVSRIDDSSLLLPDCAANEKEREYNTRAAQTAPGLLCMDRQTVQVDSYLDKIEVCDLLSATGQLIHVKPWRDSSTLSHLFAQARVSAELLLTDADFREKVIAKIESIDPRFSDVIPRDGYNPMGIEIVFAIIDSDNRPLDIRLPFFSKLNMMQAVRLLSALGYRVSKLKVARIA